ncbi:MAG: hypothetical protein RMJ98_00945 [Myxococcales bacterium]|nr:hypothetical protein [Polyangiaceae bacterium]MDW8247853.1 hypothetical protein [Myxococcales bacterium]
MPHLPRLLLLSFLLFCPSTALADGTSPGPLLGGPFLFSLAAWGSSLGERGAWLRLQVPLDLGKPHPGLTSLPRESTPLADPPTHRPWISAVRLKQLQRAAWRSVGLDVDPQRLTPRTRLAALLPRVRLRGLLSNGQTLRYTPLSEDDLRTQATGQAGTIYEVRLDFELDRLVFANDEIAIERLQQEQQQQRQQVTHRLTELLGAWHRSAARVASSELTEEERLEAEAALQAAEAALDLLTEGAWSATASQR